MKLLRTLALLLSALLVGPISAFQLRAHRGHNCIETQIKFVCFNVGYNFCCKRRLNQDRALYSSFLSMSQTATLLGDFVILHRVKGGAACGGHEVGTGIYGCADARTVAFGGKSLTCRGDCGLRKAMPTEQDIAEAQECATRSDECEGVHLADAVYYNEKAYFGRPEDDRLEALVVKMLEDQELTESELQELEAIRLPWADDPNNAVVPEDFVTGQNASMPSTSQQK